jgi:hypothetical protein
MQAKKWLITKKFAVSRWRQEKKLLIKAYAIFKRAIKFSLLRSVQQQLQHATEGSFIK